MSENWLTLSDEFNQFVDPNLDFESNNRDKNFDDYLANYLKDLSGGGADGIDFTVKNGEYEETFTLYYDQSRDVFRCKNSEGKIVDRNVQINTGKTVDGFVEIGGIFGEQGQYIGASGRLTGHESNAGRRLYLGQYSGDEEIKALVASAMIDSNSHSSERFKSRLLETTGTEMSIGIEEGGEETVDDGNAGQGNGNVTDTDTDTDVGAVTTTPPASENGGEGNGTTTAGATEVVKPSSESEYDEFKYLAEVWDHLESVGLAEESDYILVSIENGVIKTGEGQIVGHTEKIPGGEYLLSEEHNVRKFEVSSDGENEQIWAAVDSRAAYTSGVGFSEEGEVKVFSASELGNYGLTRAYVPRIRSLDCLLDQGIGTLEFVVKDNGVFVPDEEGNLAKAFNFSVTGVPEGNYAFTEEGDLTKKIGDKSYLVDSGSGKIEVPKNREAQREFLAAGGSYSDLDLMSFEEFLEECLDGDNFAIFNVDADGGIWVTKDGGVSTEGKPLGLLSYYVAEPIGDYFENPAHDFAHDNFKVIDGVLYRRDWTFGGVFGLDYIAVDLETGDYNFDHPTAEGNVITAEQIDQYYSAYASS